MTDEFDKDFTLTEVEELCKKYDRAMDEFIYFLKVNAITCCKNEYGEEFRCRDVSCFFKQSEKRKRENNRAIAREEVLRTQILTKT